MLDRTDHWSDLPSFLGYPETEDTERFPQIQQALRDLHEIYPDWQFVAAREGSEVVVRVPSPEEKHVGYLARVLRMVHDSMLERHGVGGR